MWHFAMAVPAKPVGMIIHELIIKHRDLLSSSIQFDIALHAIQLLLMASDTVILNYFDPSLADKNNLWFISKGEYRSMTQSVPGFKEILVK